MSAFGLCAVSFFVQFSWRDQVDAVLLAQVGNLLHIGW